MKTLLFVPAAWALLSFFLGVGMAQAQTTTTFHAIAKVSLPVGETISPAVTVPVGTTEAIVQITATTWTDASLLVTYSIERSDDNGATWTFIGGAETTGDAHGGQGQLPRFAIFFQDDLGNSTITGPVLARARVTINKAKTFGLDVTVMGQ